MRRFEVVDRGAKTPRRATVGSAGYDLYTPVAFGVAPHSTTKINLGIRAYMEEDEVLLINVRSSIGIKRGLTLANGQAVIDSDFAYSTDENEGRIILCFRNNTDDRVIIEEGERVAQGIFMKYLITDDDSPLSDERKGGIGSSGK